MRHWFLTCSFLAVSFISLIIFMATLAFFSVARANLKLLVSNYYPDKLHPEKNSIKDHLRKKLLFEEEDIGIPADDSNKTDEKSDDLVAN